MAKRKIIRHLEFYGYPDQNAFATAGNVSVDLSDIREKNREPQSMTGLRNSPTTSVATQRLTRGWMRLKAA